jgi:hypothetical protein
VISARIALCELHIHSNSYLVVPSHASSNPHTSEDFREQQKKEKKKKRRRISENSEIDQPGTKVLELRGDAKMPEAEVHVGYAAGFREHNPQ